VFGGFNDKQTLSALFSQLSGREGSAKQLLDEYFRLSYREGLVFDNDKKTGLRVSILNE
jgi:hypothetical protein